MRPSVYWKLCFTMTIGCVWERLWTERYSNHSSPLWVSASEVLEYEISCRRRWSGIAVSFLIEWDLGKTSLKNRSSLIGEPIELQHHEYEELKGMDQETVAERHLTKFFWFSDRNKKPFLCKLKVPFCRFAARVSYRTPHSVTHCFFHSKPQLPEAHVLFLWLWHTQCPGEHFSYSAVTVSF